MERDTTPVPYRPGTDLANANRVTDAWRLALGSLCLATTALLFGFWRTATNIAELWSNTSGNYTHGWLVLPVAAWLVWSERRDILAIEPGFDARGLIVLVAGTAAWCAARVMGAQVLEHLALLLAFVGTAWSLVGTAIMRRVWFPVAFLLFAIPIGEPLVQPLMEVTATGVVWLLRTTGFAVFRDEMFFSTSVGDFQVAATCSGIRYLMACVATGALFAKLTLRSRRAVVVMALASIVIPVVGNVFRAYLIVVIAHVSNLRYAVGVDHLLYGFVFFAFVMAALVAFGSWLGRIERRRAWIAIDVASPCDAAGGRAIVERRSSGLLGGAVTMAAVVLATATAPILAGAAMARLASPLAIDTPMPAAAPGWSGPHRPGTDWRPYFPGTPVLDTARYTQVDGQSVVVVIAHYPREGVDGELISYVNRSVDENRWRLVGTEYLKKGDLGPVRLERFESADRRNTLHVLSVFVVGEEVLASPYAVKAVSTLRRLVDPGLPAAQVFVATTDDGSGSSRDERAVEFLTSHLRKTVACMNGAGVDCRAGLN